MKGRAAGAAGGGGQASRGASTGHRASSPGAGPGVAAQAARVLAVRRPGSNVVGTYSPPVMSWDERAHDEDTLARIREAKPDILFVAFGAPKQELWLDAVRDRLGVPVGIGVGAAFDFAAGTVKRAPRWLQRAGLEWLFRLSQEPRRLWRRYLFVDPRFACCVLREKFRGRKAAAPPKPE